MSANLLEAQAGDLRKSSRGEPTWEVAGFFPRQGEWSEHDFLAMSTNRFVELNDGCLEVLPMPTPLHQAIVGLLFELLQNFLRREGLGRAFFAPMPVRLWPGQYREPDLVVLLSSRLQQLLENGLTTQPEGADLVMEVVSPGEESRRRDLVEKRSLYARAGIAEYWIVDPERQTITILALENDAYRLHGEFGSSSTASSLLLKGFDVKVADVFNAGQLKD